MKTIITTLILAFGLNTFAGNPEISMYKRSEKFQKKEHVYNFGKSAGAWLSIGGVCLFGAGVTKVISNYATLPNPTTYATIEDYNKAFDKYTRNQKTANTIFYSCIGVSGITIVFGATELFNAPLVDTKNTSLKLNSNQNGIGLCLNFK